jgi:hypothetical protein
LTLMYYKRFTRHLNHLIESNILKRTKEMLIEFLENAFNDYDIYIISWVRV